MKRRSPVEVARSTAGGGFERAPRACQIPGMMSGVARVLHRDMRRQTTPRQFFVAPGCVQNIAACNPGPWALTTRGRARARACCVTCLERSREPADDKREGFRSISLTNIRSNCKPSRGLRRSWFLCRSLLRPGSAFCATYRTKTRCLVKHDRTRRI